MFFWGSNEHRNQWWASKWWKNSSQKFLADKATCSDGIPVKLIKLSANLIDSHLVNIINRNTDLNCYSENAKIANVSLIFKTDERTKVKIPELLVS